MVNKKFAISTARKLKKSATKAERLLKKELLRKHIEFQFQKPVPKGNYKTGFFIPDFTIRIRNNSVHYNLYIEIDGGYHDTKEQRIKDIKREEFLTRNGKHLLIRFTNEQVIKNVNRVVQAIEHKIGNRVLVN